MNRSELTDDDLAKWREAWGEQLSLEAQAEKARLEGDPSAFVAFLNKLDEARTRAALLLAGAVERKCVRERFRRWFEEDSSDL
jgi:hypothetical protein